MRRFGWQVGWLLMSAVACGGLARKEPSEPSLDDSAGQGNEAGAFGVTGGVGGSGGRWPSDRCFLGQ